MKVDIEGVPEVIIERSDCARYMRITVRPGSVRVAVPAGIPLERGKSFALERAQWIQRHVARIERRAKAHKELLRDLPPMPERDKARHKIISRCEDLSKQTGLSYLHLSIRNQKTRWGSCSAQNSISLNIKLARLPQELLDYVILHELVHTRIKGHGQEFWNELDTYIGDSKRLRRKLKQYIPEHL